MHPVGGLVTDYAELPELLSSEQPVYAIGAHALHAGDSAPRSLLEMAQGYASLIERRDSRGPCQLFGWSMGGLLAQAVACELEACGADVHLVGLVDAYTRHPPYALSARAEAVGALRSMILAHNRERPGGRDLRRLLTELAREKPEEMVARAETLGLLPAGVLTADELLAMARARALHGSLVASHTPSVCKAPLLVWMAEEALPGTEREWAERSTGGVTESRVSGNHFTVLRRPQIERIAADLRAIASKRYGVAAAR
jgi:thioesterase domain-containing protein